MKRMVALLLGIALLLMSVAAADDDLNEIAARVENYLEDMTDDAGTQTLEECLELLKNVGNGPSKKALEIYCKILLNIAKENFDDANQSMYTLTLLKKNFEEEFIEHSAGITSFLTVDELGAYLQGREAEYRGDWDAAMTAYEQCAAKADVLDRMMTIEGKQYGNAIDLIDAGRYDEAHAMLEKLAERNYSYAKQMLRDWATPTPKPTATPTPTATPVPEPSIYLWVDEVSTEHVSISWQCNIEDAVCSVQKKTENGYEWQTIYVTTAQRLNSLVMSEIVLGNYTYRVVAEKLNITSNEVTVRMPGAPTPEPTGTPKPYNGYAWTKYNCMYFSAPRANKAYKVGEIPGNTLLNVIRLEYDNGDTAWAYVASDDGAYVGYVRNNALRYVSNTNTATNKLNTKATEITNPAATPLLIDEDFTVHVGTATGFGGGEVTARVILRQPIMQGGKDTIAWLFIDASTQTPGMGTKCAEDGDFKWQFLDKSGPFILGENADALTGATVTSTAVVEAINAALSAPATSEKATWVSVQAFSVQAFDGEYIGVGVTDENGVITSLMIDASSQTPGLGQECANAAFTSQFIGKKAPFVLNENIDAVTSATITSQAVVDAVNSIYGY